MKKNFLNPKGKVCGWWTDGIYRKRVDPSKHLLKIMDAYGIEENIVQELKNLGTNEIRIMETDTCRVLSIPFDGFLKNGVTRNFESKQMFVSRKFFKPD